MTAASAPNYATAIEKQSSLDQRIAAVRRFNRFYTRQIGLLQDRMYQSPFSLTEVRVLYELAHRARPTASELSRDLGLDPGYLSRVLRSFEKRKLIARSPSASDGRQSLLSLSEHGKKVFAPIDQRSHDEVGAVIGKLAVTDQARLIEAMRTMENLFGDQPEPKSPYLLRPHQPGDMGWVVYRHGILYSQEYGYDENFEALVAEIVARFIQHFDSKAERCWIAERNGEIVGSVFLVKQSKTVAKLRLLLVEPKARGLGIGKRLVEECVRFARQVGYRKITLWTQSELQAARGIYQSAGFQLVKKTPHDSWGRHSISEIWDMKL